MMEKKIQLLKRYLDESRYTVAVCGSGMMLEGGIQGVKLQERAYAIEEKYNDSPEDIFSSAYFNARPEVFFRFYREEMLSQVPEVTESAYTLAAMERAGKIQCIITANIYESPQKGGCQNVINLHGSIYRNNCVHCGRQYPVEYIMNSRGIPVCESCKNIIRPNVALFGEMVDSHLLTAALREIERAELLLVLGTTLHSEVFERYIRSFSGKYMVIIHENDDYADHNASLVILEQPRNVLPKLGY